MSQYFLGPVGSSLVTPTLSILYDNNIFVDLYCVITVSLLCDDSSELFSPLILTDLKCPLGLVK